jgi:hypothetical protein
MVDEMIDIVRCPVSAKAEGIVDESVEKAIDI